MVYNILETPFHLFGACSLSLSLATCASKFVGCKSSNVYNSRHISYFQIMYPYGIYTLYDLNPYVRRWLRGRPYISHESIYLSAASVPMGSSSYHPVPPAPAGWSDASFQSDGFCQERGSGLTPWFWPGRWTSGSLEVFPGLVNV